MEIIQEKKIFCKPKLFDISSREDDQELKLWCSLHWRDTFYRAIRSNNPPTYHDCCMSFSRRRFVKRFSHPKLQSATLSQIPTLKKIESPEGLYEWLKQRLHMHYRLGKKPYFPSINIAHCTEDDDISLEINCDEELLTKRQREDSAEKKKMIEEIKYLKEENKKLLNSSKMW